MHSKDQDRRNILHLASENGHVMIASILIQAGLAPKLHTRDSMGMTPLHLACMHGKSPIVEMLLQCNLGLTATDFQSMFLVSCSTTRDLIRPKAFPSILQ